ncbi:hypothetical protein AX14_001810 [Amanita brunnescens Koide BX004]|nr:hypothetical protein AX14_001810 [Amanita brunnescens Koide BX004]
MVTGRLARRSKYSGLTFVTLMSLADTCGRKAEDFAKDIDGSKSNGELWLSPDVDVTNASISAPRRPRASCPTQRTRLNHNPRRASASAAAAPYYEPWPLLYIHIAHDIFASPYPCETSVATPSTGVASPLSTTSRAPPSAHCRPHPLLILPAPSSVRPHHIPSTL